MCPIRRLLMVVLLVVGLVAVAWPVAAAPPDAPAGRARQLERAARDLAVRLRAVPVRDGDFADPGRYCPADRLAVSWAPPAGAFRFGAYIPPLGPAPGPATTSVNGVVTCRGATYAYMGFEARWTTGGWRVVDVPALDEPAPPPASGRPARPGAAAPLAAAALPPPGTGPLDDLAPYQPQTTCSPRPKPGVVGFQRIVLASFPATHSSGISRACSIGGHSEHKEGRAWDWAVTVGNPSHRAAARQVFTWLFRADPSGRRFAMARRLGVMYIIHNRRIWGSYRATEGWRPYVGANPHTDHVHFSFGWAGARKRTSWWDGTPVTYGSPT
ncbi:MAG TPA: hypothetical protein VK713_00455 [Actinomycetes bacterium]|jgi:hypothetical protein|nr:hypothetical protein [Actinomycetes bacterium]